MRTGMHMTIQDYFQRSGLQAAGRVAPKKPSSGLPIDAASFAEALSTARSAQGSGPNGLTIRDYLARPVQLRRLPPEGLTTVVHEAVARQNIIPKPVPPSDNNDESTIRKPAAPETAAADDKAARIQASIHKAANRFELLPALIEAVIKAESAYDDRAVSPAGAQGLMQLMPATARELGVHNPFDIDQNIQGGARYLRDMLDRFKGDLRLALSAYNAGPGTVSKYKGNVPYTETKNYVQRVMKYSRQLSEA